MLRKKVTVVLLYHESMPYDAAAMVASVESVLAQDYPKVELVVVDDRGPSATLDFLPEALRSDGRIRHLPGSYRNRSAKWNAAIAAATGDLLVLVENDKKHLITKAKSQK